MAFIGRIYAVCTQHPLSLASLNPLQTNSNKGQKWAKSVRNSSIAFPSLLRLKWNLINPRATFPPFSSAELDKNKPLQTIFRVYFRLPSFACPPPTLSSWFMKISDNQFGLAKIWPIFWPVQLSHKAHNFITYRFLIIYSRPYHTHLLCISEIEQSFSSPNH